MTKNLRKAVSNRPRLENRYCREINQLKVLGPIRSRETVVADFIKESEKGIIAT